MPSDPFKELTSLLDDRMKNHAAQAVSGTPSELGVITSTGLKLDGFKHEIRDFLVAEWTLKVEIPRSSRVIITAAPVNPDGTDIPETTHYSNLSRLDFNVQGMDENSTKEVRLDVKSGLKPGDRVLAVPVNGGQDAVVICKVVS